MPSDARSEISVVLPTYNRAAALRTTFAGLLALEGVGEVVVVDDGSRDATVAVLGGYRHHPGVVLVRQPRNLGAPAARNAGAAAARGRWVLFAEDDCCFPPDYAAVLRGEAAAHDADVVGAPMVHPGPGESVPAAVERCRAEGAGANGLDEVAGFPAGPAVATPLLPAPSLVRRDVLLAVGFDEGYRGNAYREETDFYLRATYAGHRCILTPHTYFWEAGRWAGGQTRPRALTEYWTVRNNARFLRRHRHWLAEQGHLSSPLREQLAFVQRRGRRWWAEARAVESGPTHRDWARS